MILPLLTSALLLSGQALAGGLGLVGAGGVHQDRVYYYTEDADSGALIQGPADVQLNPSFGGGLEIILGDRDNKVLGFVRGYYFGDAPQKVPDAVSAANNARTTLRNVAMVSAGMQWGIVGDPQALQLTVNAALGTSFLEQDPSEDVDLRPYALVEAGPGVTYMLTETLQLAGSVGAGVRYSKRLYFSGVAYLGVRYLFD